MALTSIERGAFRVTIHEADLDALAGFACAYPRRETGGNLFGFWTHSGAPTVQLVLGPGPGARHESVSFFQDPAYMANEGGQVQRAFGLQHIGDWHSHHTLGLTQPSSGDALTIRRTLAAHGFPRFLAVIATIQPEADGRFDRDSDRGRRSRLPEPAVDFNAYLFEASSAGMRRGSWVVLLGSSPVSDAAEHRQVARLGRRSIATWRVEQAPAVATPPAGWYTQRWGTEFVRTLDARCRQVFGNCRIASGPDSGDLYYTFEHHGAPGAIAFPAAFPQEPPVIMVGELDVPVTPYRSGASQDELAELLVRAAVAGGVSAVGDGSEPDEEVSDGLEPRAADEA